jgi:hypothetical protein
MEYIQRSESNRDSEERMNEDFYTFEEPDALAIPAEVTNRYADQGLVLRWIRTSIRGKDDITNVGKRIQDGWEFVQPDEVPEMAHNSFVKEEGRYAGTVTRGDLSLAKCPTARANARREFYENRSREMMDSVNAQLSQHQDSRAPISNSSKSKVVKGRMPTFQE